MLFSGDPLDPTPFEVDFETTAESDDGWAQFTFPWTGFEKAEWVGDAGLAEIDPARMIGYGFSIGAGEGTLWVDDVALVTGEEQPQPAPTAEPAEEPAEEPIEESEEESGGGICPGAAALPLGAVGVVLYNGLRKEQKSGG